MGKTLKALKQAVKAGVAAAREPVPELDRYIIGEKPLLCLRCGGGLFKRNATISLLPDFEGDALECARCSHVEIFAKKGVVKVAV